MSIAVLDHLFRNHKSEEMICWQCGYVVWRCSNEQEVRAAMMAISGIERRCGKAWGHTIPLK